MSELSSGSEEHSDGEEYTGSESGSTEEGSEEETDEEASDHEEDEPVLKYRRFAKEVVNSISGASEEENNIICCISVHPKFIALGTYNGTIELLDNTGTFLKDRVYTLHTAQINQISLDEEGEFLASCSDDGKVSIVGLFTTKYNNTVPFDRQVKSLAIHPHFSKSTNRVFVIGHDRLVMIEERRWPLGNKVTELHGGYGFISTIKWKESLIAWANERMVVVYDTGLKQNISAITFEEKSPTFLPCSLYWQDISTLLVGRGHLVKTVMVKGSEGDRSGTFSGVVNAMMKRRCMAIVAQNTFPQFLVCGVVPLFDDKQEWKLVVLGYNAKVDQQDAIQKGTVPPPHLVVVSPGWYLQQGEEFETPEYNARFKLLPRGHNFCRCEEFHLEYILREDRFYILTPIDIIHTVLAQQKRDDTGQDATDYDSATDHIEWLMKKRQSALRPPKHTGLEYVYHLIKSKKYPEAARTLRNCPEVLYCNKSKWEDIILSFLEAGQIQEIYSFIPTSKPQLSRTIYGLVINNFLQEDCKILFELIKVWPTSLYSSRAIIKAVQYKMREVHDPETTNYLLKVKALLTVHLENKDEQELFPTVCIEVPENCPVEEPKCPEGKEYQECDTACPENKEEQESRPTKHVEDYSECFYSNALQGTWRCLY